jgi:hypothetical protein
MTSRIAVAMEISPKKTFASAIDWPGLARSGKTESLALEALAAYRERYRPVAALAVAAFPAPGFELEVVESGEGGASTAFGVPSLVTAADRRATDAAEGARLGWIVEAAWEWLARVAAAAPEELRKGPRGGGRHRSKIVAHVQDAEWYYAKEMGIRVPQPAAGDEDALLALRAAILEVLRRPSDGTPLAGRKWTVRYAAHRIAWHALDHAWEIEDRSILA